MARFRIVNGERVDFTPEEETERDASEAAWQAEKDAEAAKPPPVTTAERLSALTEAVHALATGKQAPAEAVELLGRIRKK